MLQFQNFKMDTSLMFDIKSLYDNIVTKQKFQTVEVT